MPKRAALPKIAKRKSSKTAAPKPQRKRVPKSALKATASARNKPSSKYGIPRMENISLHSLRATSLKPLAVADGAEPGAQTLIYVHGVGNKPPQSVLKCQWDYALFGVELGDKSRMAYWVNREYYPTPSDDTCDQEDVVSIDDDEASTASILALARQAPSDEGDALAAEIQALTDDPQRQQLLAILARKMIKTADASTSVAVDGFSAAEVHAKILPLPPFLRRLITRKLTRAFLRDVYDFLYSTDRRGAMERALTDRLQPGGGPFVVIAHSQGSMIAYDVLRQLTKAQCDVRLFITIGSPLGIAEVQDVFREWVPGGVLKVPACVTRWVNVADLIDPVAFDKTLADEFSDGDIEDFLALNADSPLHPHSATGYLKTPPVQREVRAAVNNAFGQPVGRAVITKDLVRDLENGRRDDRHDTLIQLTSDTTSRESEMDLPQIRAELVATIRHMVSESGGDPDGARIEPLKRFVAAKLTRHEVEQLRTKFDDLRIERVWKDAVKSALICDSTHTVQAAPANLGYAATGQGIRWAVLDTGIRGDHPHFAAYQNVKRQWDCTQPGAPQPHDPGDPSFAGMDQHGHGTHVAGTIAGLLEVPFKTEEKPRRFAGMAPQAELYGFKVLDAQGDGKDSWIIKALDLIGDLNEAKGFPFIAGLNLSLGGNFDPSVYGCGHTPLCNELRRLWNQGVFVCLAAGNDGYALLQAAHGEIPANLDLSIGDPANLEEAIAVGSIHKTNPQTYGVSYFSSRGPTADGRRKPDVVAPGERILSAFHAFDARKKRKDWLVRDLYIEMSGTSMAAPHVSGLVAAFLSRRNEFIGYPAQLKSILLANCTDIARDPYIQGHGVPNLIKMLLNVA